MIFLDESGNLDPAYSSLERELIQATNINATYIANDAIGSCTSKGTYDGIIGDLESNFTDFAIIPTTIEPLSDPRCKFPPSFDSVLLQQNSFILSSPPSGEKKIVTSIHEALNVLDYTTISFLFLIYLISIQLLSISKFINKLANNRVWTLTRIWLNQDVPDCSDTCQSEKIILNVSKVAVFQVIVLVCALVNTDMVCYVKPKIIDSISDAIESGMNISFVQALATYSILKSAPDGTERKRLFDHALNQSKSRNIFVETNADFAFEIKKGSFISVLGDLSFEVTKRIDCLDSQSYQWYHRSKEYVYSERKAILFSRMCNPEVRYRVNQIHTKAMEHGFYEKDLNDHPEKVMSIFFPGLNPSIYCIHSSFERNLPIGDVTISFPEIQLFLVHTIFIFILCVIIFLIEYLIHKKLFVKVHAIISRKQSENIFYLRNKRIDAAIAKNRKTYEGKQ